MEEKNELHIPDIAYDIPLKDFLEWYDNKLSNDWEKMNLKQRDEYFQSIDKDTLTHFQKEFKMNPKLMEAQRNAGARFLDSDKIYYRFIEVLKLENDIDALQKAARQFFAERAVKKLQSAIAEESLNDWLIRNKSK